ncbi:MAG TPA: hypothetical protein VGC42_02325 [Kofleriaceae bacterium]
MIRALALGGLALAGCAQLAGLDTTSGVGSGSGSQQAVDTLVIERMSVGATMITAPLDLTGLTANYLVGDAAAPTRMAATSPAAGTWQAPLAAAAPVEFTLPDQPTPPAPIPRLYAFPTPTLKLLFAPLEHPSPTPAPPTPANIALTVPLDAPTAATDSFLIYTVGSWTSRGITAAELPVAGSTTIGPFTYDFQTSGSITGRPLERITSKDAYLVLRYTGSTLTGVSQAGAFDQTGTDTVMTSMMAPVTAAPGGDVAVNPTMIAQRYAALRPAVSGVVMNWSVSAAPGYKIASNAGPLLAGAPVATTDTSISLSFANPFVGRGWNAVLTLGTAASRTYTPAGMTASIVLSASMNHFLIPAAGDVADLPAGLPLTLMFNGAALTTDGTEIPTPTSPVRITLTTDKPAATVYTLQLLDILPNADNTALGLHVVYVAASDQPSFSLPPEAFKTGHMYTLRTFSTVGGYPSIASGDLTDRALPLAQAFFDSAVIKVMP